MGVLSAVIILVSIKDSFHPFFTPVYIKDFLDDKILSLNSGENFRNLFAVRRSLLRIWSREVVHEWLLFWICKAVFYRQPVFRGRTSLMNTLHELVKFLLNLKLHWGITWVTLDIMHERLCIERTYLYLYSGQWICW